MADLRKPSWKIAHYQDTQRGGAKGLLERLERYGSWQSHYSSHSEYHEFFIPSRKSFKLTITASCGTGST